MRRCSYLIFTVFVMSGCDLLSNDPCEDEYAPQYVINLVVSPPALNMDDGDIAAVSVLVLDQCSHPHPAGEQILFQAIADGNEGTGRFGHSNESREVALLDTSGGATSSFECTEPTQATLVAQLQSGTYGAIRVDCVGGD